MPDETRILWIMRDDGDMTEPMNIMLLSALGKTNRPWRHSYLALLERDNIIDKIREFRPQIIAASAITGSHKYYLEALKQIKETFGSSVFTILGGPYCSTYPEVIATAEYLDAIGVLECDDAWPEFLDAFEKNRDDIHNIKNIITRENHRQILKRRIIDNGQLQTFIDPAFYRNRRDDFDSLPYMDRALIYENTAFKTRFKRTHMAGRGCPFRCTYCFEKDWNDMYRGKGKMLQRYSPVRFCEELVDCMRYYDTRFWKFYDDVFPTFKHDMEWLREFADVYPRLVGLPFHCLTRCDLVRENEEVLHLLKRAGIASLTMSIESGNSFIRDHIITRDMTGYDIEYAFGLARKLKISTFSNTILGIPGPKIPLPNDSDFETKIKEIADDSIYYRVSRSGKQLDLREVIEPARGWFTDSSDWKKFVVDYLKRVGLHSNQLKYDHESVKYNLRLGVSIGEYPIMYPYPRTAAGEYVIKKGWFDGNYDALHASYQNRSPLNCFTTKEKIVQQNLALLGLFCMLFTGSSNRLIYWTGRVISYFCLNWLVKIQSAKATWVYERLYTIAKSYMYQTRIYPMRKSLRERGRIFLETWRLDLWKQFGEKKPLYRNERPGQTLGGPPSV